MKFISGINLVLPTLFSQNHLINMVTNRYRILIFSRNVKVTSNKKITFLKIVLQLVKKINVF